MSQDNPSNADILGALHQHDIRLVRLEADMEGLQRDVTTQASRMDRVVAKLEELAETVAGLEGTQKMIFWIVATGIPLILGLDLWSRISQ